MKIEIKNYYSGEVIFSHKCENNTIYLTLKEAIKSGADLSGANLSRADLSGADLSGADLSIANLSRANLSEANLWRANLWRADLSEADLSEANLSEADLSEANLSRADLSRAIYIDGLPIVKTLFLAGSRNTVFWIGRNWIKIGCIEKSIEEWENEFKEIGKAHSYSDKQIAEYGQYIQICKQLQATL